MIWELQLIYFGGLSAERPLTVKELKTAIAIQPGHRSMSDLSEMMQLDLESVLRSMLGAIITVQGDTVHLVHQSTKEFIRETNLITSEKISSLHSTESNHHIAISCLTYLSFNKFENPGLYNQVWGSMNGLVDYPLFHYSSSH
jgi:hypothetical protein